MTAHSGSEPQALSALRDAVLPTYARADVTIVRGDGCSVWDDTGRVYLDFGAGIAVVGLGHLRAGAARRRARAARPSLARVEPLLDGADAASRRAAGATFRRRAGVLLPTRAPRRTRQPSRSRARQPAGRGSWRSRAASTAARSAPALGHRPALEVGGLRPLLPGIAFAQPNDVESLDGLAPGLGHGA